MKFTAVFEDSNAVRTAPTYVEILGAVSEEIGVLQSQLILEADPVDGNQWEEVYLYAERPPVAKIYDEEQYARIRS